MKGIWVMIAMLGLALPAQAQVQAQGAWVRATVKGQSTSGAFMELKSAAPAALVGAETTVAGKVEIHEMRMQGEVMRMRRVPRVQLPAGKTVELKSGGYHLMLIDLKKPLKKGDSVSLRLKIEQGDKPLQTIEVKAEVRDLAATGEHLHH